MTEGRHNFRHLEAALHPSSLIRRQVLLVVLGGLHVLGLDVLPLSLVPMLASRSPDCRIQLYVRPC
jgi:hypothetical protein